MHCTDPSRERASELADWAWTWLVNRTDRFGCQTFKDDGSIGRITGWDLARERLVRHFQAGDDPSTLDIIGVHATALDETCRWIGIDIDKHKEEDPEANFRFARSIFKQCRRGGTVPRS